MIEKHLLAWIPMVFLAILNGVIRDATYGQALSNELAHQVSTITLILIFTVYIGFLSRKWPLHSLFTCRRNRRRMADAHRCI
jgi:hypothetical protein